MPGQPTIEEAELVARVVAGDRRAFTDLVRPLTPRLLVTALRMLGSKSDAEDAVQAALASAWIARSRFDPERPVGPLMTTITVNKCRDRLRRQKAARFLGYRADHDLEFVEDTSPSPESEAADRQALRNARIQIRKLPVRLQEALVLVAIDGRTQSEAAALLGVTEKTVETRIYRARKLLREKLGVA